MLFRRLTDDVYVLYSKFLKLYIKEAMMALFKKVLFPTDFSESASEVFKYALSIAEKHGSKIDIIHIIQEPVEMMDVYLPHISYDVLGKEMEEASRKNMKKFCDENIKGKADFEIHIRKGTPFVEIICAARELGDDVIVMGTHGRSGIDHVLFGSTAEKVVRKSPVPVLTVRCDNRDFKMP